MPHARIVVGLPICMVVCIIGKMSRWRNKVRMLEPEAVVGFPVLEHITNEHQMVGESEKMDSPQQECNGVFECGQYDTS